MLNKSIKETHEFEILADMYKEMFDIRENINHYSE